MDIGRKLADLENRLNRIERSSRLSNASIDDTAVQVRDGTGSLRGLIGLQADGTTAVNIVNGPPPPQPTAPALASVLGGVTASWDGSFADGSTIPLDFARIEVHASTTNGFTPDTSTLKSTIESPQAGTVTIATDTPVYVRLLARSTSGTASTPSDQTGPLGPLAVVASDVLDGIITTVKLADDAVTAAKVATAAIGTTEIADDAVTTAKIIAGAILAGQIAAGAVLTDKLAAEAVTAAKIAALTITADKIAANAITTSKLSAGSVDATALAADAITGKTITGGTITGTTITGGVLQTASSGQRITLNEAGANKVLVYNSSGTAIGELSAQGLLVKGTTGAVIWVDPNSTYPSLKFYNAASTNAAAIDVVEPTTGDANLEMLSGTFTGSGHTYMRWRTILSRDAAAIERYSQDGSPFPKIGGRLYLNDTYGNIGYINEEDTTKSTGFTVEANLAHLNAGRLQVFPPASSNSAFYVEADPSHTGNLLRLYRSADKFVVDKDGNVTLAGDITLASGHKIIGGAKQTPTYEANFAGGSSAATRYAALSYRITAEGLLHIVGHFKSTTARAAGAYTAFILPSGYIPTDLYSAGAIHVSSADVWRTAIRVNVDNTGSVNFSTTSAISANDGFYVNLLVPMA